MTIIVRFYTEFKQTILNAWCVKTIGGRRGAQAFAPWQLGVKIKIL